MKTPSNNKPLLKPLPHAEIILGTLVTQIAALAWLLCRKYNLDPKIVIQRLIFDWMGKPALHDDGEPALEIDHCFGPEEFVEARLSTDTAALQKAEDRGDLYAVPEDWLNKLGAVAENMGAAGEPIMGLILAILNRRRIKRRLRKMIQEAIAHSGQDQRVLQGLDDGRLSGRLIVKLRLSDVGGMGSGAMHWFLGEDGVRACARQDGVDVSLILYVLCRGNLETKDDDRSDLNEFIAIKHLQTLFTGVYVSPVTGKRQPIPCAALFLSSNQNGNGDMTDFRQVQAHEAHCDHFVFATPGGARMRELLIDILEHDHNDYGEPLAGKTVFCAFVSRNSARVSKYCTLRGTALMARAATAPSEPGKSQQYAANLIRQSLVLESQEDAELTKLLTHPEEFNRQDVIATALGSFTDRTQGCHCLNRLVVGLNAFHGILNNDISQTYEAAMAQQGRSHVSTVQDLLAKHQDQLMRSRHGLSESRDIHASLSLVLGRSQEVLMQKISELDELIVSHEQIIAEVTEEVENLQRSNWLARAINRPLIQRLWQSLRESATAVIGHQLRKVSCKIAINEVLMPLTTYVGNQLGWLDSMEHKLIQTAQIAENRAKDVAAQPTTMDVPQGLELADDQYLDAFFAAYVANHGDEDDCATFLLGQYLCRHGSLAYLTDAPLEEYERAFGEVCDGVFQPETQRTDVVSEFQRLYPDPNMQLKLFGRLIKQSEGCFQVTGEMDDPVTWIKTANAPSEAAAEWLRGMLERADGKPGTWEVQVHRDPDRIGIAQLRGNIALQPILDRCRLCDDPKTWAILVEHAPDPVSVLIVPPNPTARQLKRVLAKAIAIDLLCVDETGAFMIEPASGEKLVLANDFEAAAAVLRSRWPELVNIESTFGSRLVTQEELILRRLTELKGCLAAKDSNKDARVSLIDHLALEECLKQTELLLPRMHRIRKARQRRLLHAAQ